jgi:zinc transport system substrate-binding protein
VLLALTGCQRAGEESGTAPTSTMEDSTPTVYAVNYPLAWMAQRIGGDSVRVLLPVPEGVDPAHWQPSPETVLEYQRADLVLLNGAGYAGWIEFASLPPGRLVDTTRGLEDRFVPAGGVTHTHGPTGEHDHADVASHTWVDPDLAAGQARAIAGAFGRLRPELGDDFRQRLASLEADLARLDERLALAFRAWPEAGVLYSHPVYQYLDARYGLGGWSMTWEPGEDPGAAEWDALAARIADEPANVMLWEGEPLPETAARLRRMGIEPVVFRTGAAAPTGGDYLQLMEENLARLVEVDVLQGGSED